MQRQSRHGPVLAALQDMLPAPRPLGLHEPDIGAAEQAQVQACLDSGWISTAGRHVDRFERDLVERSGVGHAVATVNGTAALHLCLLLAGVVAGDEVIVPALTFVGTVNPVRYLDAVPHFVDCEADTLGMDPGALEAHLAASAELRAGQCINLATGRHIAAMVVVHVLGIPARMDALAAVAARWNLALVEDAAEALGSRRDGRHAGSWGMLSALSFNGNKIISTGGGGAVLTGDPLLAARARHLSTTAKQPHAWEFRHDAVGYNYRMPNLNAALGCAQLARLDEFLEAKRRLHARYRETFAGVPGVRMHTPPPDVASNHWLNLLLLDDATGRDALLAAANEAGLLLRPFWNPMHLLPMFDACPSAELSRTEHLWRHGVCLPGSPRLAG